MIKINDIGDLRISFFKNLRFTPSSHYREKLFVTEGERVTLKLLNSDFEIVTLFAVQEFFRKYDNIISTKYLPSDNLLYAEKSIMNLIVGYKHHSGIMALAKQPLTPMLDELSSPIIVLNGIINSENVGSIIRNCAAFGVDSIIVDKHTSSPFLRRAVRVSMGAVMDIKVYYSENIIDDLTKLRKSGFKIISAEISSNSVPINSFSFPEKFTIIFGQEDKGVDNEILEISDKVIHIPITGKVNSINVSASSAVILSKLLEQRHQILKFT